MKKKDTSRFIIPLLHFRGSTHKFEFHTHKRKELQVLAFLNQYLLLFAENDNDKAFLNCFNWYNKVKEYRQKWNTVTRGGRRHN